MINKVAVTSVQKHIQDTREQLGEVQWSDQYGVNIQMLSPIKKAVIPQELIKGIVLNSASMGIETTQAGGRAVNYFSENVPDDVSVTFYNKINVGYTDIPIIRDAIGRVKHLQDIADNIDNKVTVIGGLFGITEITQPISAFLNDATGYGDQGLDFLANTSRDINAVKSFFSFGGNSNPFSGFSGTSIEVLTAWYFFKVGQKDIVPMDGTMLLPEDWKFEIEVYSLDSAWHEHRISLGEYNIEGNTQITYTSDGGAMQEFELNFKRLI